jgi:hypothetical protein
MRSRRSGRFTGSSARHSANRRSLGRVAEVDRSEHVDVLHGQDGERLIERSGSWRSPRWEANGHGEHSVEATLRELHGDIDRSGVALVLWMTNTWWASVWSSLSSDPESHRWHSFT